MTVQEETPKAEAMPGSGKKPMPGNKRCRWLIGGGILLALAVIFSAFLVARGIAAYNAEEAEEERVEWFEDRFYEFNSANQSYKGYSPPDDFEDACEWDRIASSRLGKRSDSPYCSVREFVSPEPNSYTIIVDGTLRFTSAQQLIETACKTIEGKGSFRGPIAAGEEYGLTVIGKPAGFKYYEGTCGAEDMKLMKASTMENPVIKNNKGGWPKAAASAAGP